MTAPDVGHACTLFEFGDDAGKRWEQVFDRVFGIVRAEEALGALEHLGIVLVPANAITCAEGGCDLGLIAHQGANDLERSGDEGRTVVLGRREGLLGGRV